MQRYNWYDDDSGGIGNLKVTRQRPAGGRRRRKHRDRDGKASRGEYGEGMSHPHPTMASGGAP